MAPLALSRAGATAAAPAAAGAAAQRQRQRPRLVVVAGQGFGAAAPKTSSKAKGERSSKKQQSKLARYLDKEPAQVAAADPDDGWVEMPGVDAETTFLSKPIKPLILATGRAVCLYQAEGRIFASDANSTAYKYPLADANLLSVKGKPAVESPLDGTVYDLASGKVLSWCPKNTMMRKVLGGLKDKSEPEDLPVYPVQVRDGRVFVKFV